MKQVRSKARVLKDYLLQEMSQCIPIGGRLPSESQLTAQLSLSRST